MNGNRSAKSDDTSPRVGGVYRHVRRANTYTVVGEATLQTDVAAPDYASLIVYQGDDGRWWARPSKEFSDGRFELESRGSDRSVSK